MTMKKKNGEHNDEQKWQTATSVGNCRLFGEQVSSFPICLSDTHSNDHVANGDIWQMTMMSTKMTRTTTTMMATMKTSSIVEEKCKCLLMDLSDLPLQSNKLFKIDATSQK